MRAPFGVRTGLGKPFAGQTTQHIDEALRAAASALQAGGVVKAAPVKKLTPPPTKG
jgi:hypothetical protein